MTQQQKMKYPNYSIVSNSVIIDAIERGDVKTIQKLDNDGFYISKFFMIKILDHTKPDVVFPVFKWMCEHGRYSKESTLLYCIKHGNDDFINCVMKHGTTLSTNIIAAAAEKRKHNLVMQLIILGCPWDTRVAKYTVAYGQVEDFNELIQLGCPLDDNVIEAAIEHNRFDMIYLLWKIKCPISDDGGCSTAACLNNVDLLKYMLELGFPCCGETAYTFAIVNNNIDVIKVLNNKGYKCTEVAFYYAFKYNHMDIFNYLVKHTDFNDKEIIIWDGTIDL